MAEFKGKKVTLNKPRNISKGSPSYGRKQKEVFVKDGGKVKRVTFGDPNMKKRSNEPKRKKAFRDRHNCDNPGPSTKARYWACKDW